MSDQNNSEYRIPTSTEEQVSRANQELQIEPTSNVNKEPVSIDQNREEINKIYSIVGKAGVDSAIGIKGPEAIICDLSKELYRKAQNLNDARTDKISELNKAA